MRISRWDSLDWGLAAVLSACSLCLVFIVDTLGSTRTSHETGVVLSSQFTPGTTSTGTGIGSSPSGPVAVATISSTPDEYKALIETDGRKVIADVIDRDLWVNLAPGTKVSIGKRKSWILGMERGYSVYSIDDRAEYQPAP